MTLVTCPFYEYFQVTCDGDGNTYKCPIHDICAGMSELDVFTINKIRECVDLITEIHK